MRFLVGLLVLIFLGSCTFLGKGVFIKRKYTKGYHIDLASHKCSEPKDKIRIQEKISSTEEKEIVVIEKQKPEPSLEELLKEKEITASLSNPKPLVGSLPTRKRFIYGDPKQTLVKKVIGLKEKKSAYADFKLALILILFVVLAIIYTISILYNYPAFPFGLAVVIAVIGALLTLLTGRFLL